MLQQLFALKKTGILTDTENYLTATPELSEYMVESFQPDFSKMHPVVDNLRISAQAGKLL